MTLDYSIILTFLLGTLIYGIIRGRGVHTIRDYSIGNKRISRFALTATIAATIIGGGSTIGNAALIYKVGIIVFVGSIFECINYLVIARWVAPRMMNNKCLTIGEFVGQYYGKRGRVVTGCAGFILCAAAIGAQIGAIGYLTQYFLGISPMLGILCAFGSIVLYSAFGGFRSVVATDVVQFLVLIVAFPMIAVFALNEVGGFEAIIQAVPKSKLSFFPSFEIGSLYWLIYLSFAIPGFEPQITQRLFASGDVKRVQKSFLTSGLLLIPLGVILMIVGLSAIILFPDIEPHTALLRIIDTFLPSGIKGIAICGILAVVLSTADSLLNAGSILLVHDVYKPLARKPLKSVFELRLVRLMTLFVGFAAMLIAIYHEAIFDMVRFGYMTWDPLIIIPVFAALWGYIPSKKAYAVATLGTLTLIVIWANLKNFLIIEPTYPALILNGILLFTVDRKHLKKNISLRQKTKKALSKAGKYLGFFRRLKQSFKERMSHKEPQYRPFAIILIVYLIGFYQYYSWGRVEEALGPMGVDVYASFIYIAGALCFLLLFYKNIGALYDVWVPWIWLSALLFCLPFLSSIYFLILGYDLLVLLNIGASLFLLLLLVDWLIAFILYPLGLFLACLVLNHYYPRLFAQNGEGLITLGTYLTVFIGIVGLVFLRNQALLFKEKMSTLSALSGSIAHEIRTPLAVIGNACYAMRKRIKKFEERPFSQPAHEALVKDLQKSLSLIERSKRNADTIINMLLMKIREGVHEEPRVLSAKDIVRKALSDYGFREDEFKIIRVRGGDFLFLGTEDGLKHVLFNLLKNALYYVKKAGRAEVSGAITIDLLPDTADYNSICFKDLGTGIPAEDIPYLFDKFYTKTRHGTGLGLYFCKSVMEDLGGHIECRSLEGEYTEFRLLFPKTQE